MVSCAPTRLLLCVLLSVSIAGCDDPKQISKEALIEKTHHWKEPKVASWYYVGSKAGWDYFRYDDLGVSDLYCTQSGQIALPQTFPFTKDRRQWVVMKWGPAATPTI